MNSSLYVVGPFDFKSDWTEKLTNSCRTESPGWWLHVADALPDCLWRFLKCSRAHQAAYWHLVIFCFK